MPMAMKIILCGAITSALLPNLAYAYRPFDGTDASVTDVGEVEMELGYLDYLREGGEKSIIAPAIVMNIGLENDNELVLEGKANTRLNNSGDTRRTELDDAAFSFKQIHRRGVLQNEAGLSIASECGVLLPSLHGEKVGATCASIASQRWNAVTVHFNAALSRNRERDWGQVCGSNYRRERHWEDEASAGGID